MKTFVCGCGNPIYFENDRCLVCGQALGFVPDAMVMARFERMPGGPDLVTHPGRGYRPCANYAQHRTCNWMVPETDPDRYCVACRLNEVIPNLDEPRRLELWYEVEKAKRRLLYTLMALRLPIEGKTERDDGLAFRILADARLDNDRATAHIEAPVTTGHYAGRITINLLEADHSLREEMREAMNESYRTLLGHFRHEAGHYYWARLVEGRDIERFRAVFGDERRDYGQALRRYYDVGPPDDWREHHVAPYASMHPFEDFADTWAHYLHMVDTLETAADSRLKVGDRSLRMPSSRAPQYDLIGGTSEQAHFDDLLEDWTELTLVMNRLNRSMGLADAYPFSLSPNVVEKLRYVHHLVES